MELGGTLLPPLTENHPAQKSLAEMGGTVQNFLGFDNYWEVKKYFTFTPTLNHLVSPPLQKIVYWCVKVSLYLNFAALFRIDVMIIEPTNETCSRLVMMMVMHL